MMKNFLDFYFLASKRIFEFWLELELQVYRYGSPNRNSEAPMRALNGLFHSDELFTESDSA